MNQLCTIGTSYSAFENSDNRDSNEPSTEYTIFYIMGEEVRQMKINAASPFKALKIFKDLFPDTYDNSAIKEIEPPVMKVNQQKKIKEIKIPDMPKAIELTEYKKDFILKHHGSMSIKNIAGNLNVSEWKVGEWMKELSLENQKGKRYEPSPVSKFFSHDRNMVTI